MQMVRALLVIVFLLLPEAGLLAQKQLVILKRERVVHRFYPGDEFVFSLRSSPRQVLESYVNNIYDTAVVAHDNVIAFYKINRVYFRKNSLWNDAGPKLIIAGVGYFLIDQFNTVVVQKQEASLNRNVNITSAALVGAGTLMMLTRKNYQKLGGRYRLRMVEEGSSFYRPDHRTDMSGQD